MEEIIVAEEPKKGRREVVVERMRVKHPDLDVDDEEALFGTIEADYAASESQAERYAKTEDALQKMLDVFNSNPEAAGLYVDLAKGGKSVLEYLIERFGDDFREALDDPDMRAKIVEAEHKYRAKVSRDKELQEEAKQNLSMSLDALDAAAAECEVGEAEREAAFNAFVSMVDDAIRDKVSKETWIMFIKGLTHDKNVEEAAEEGEVRGRNMRIRERLKKPIDRVPPMLGGQGNDDMPSERPSYGGFLDKVREGDWYSRSKK